MPLHLNSMSLLSCVTQKFHDLSLVVVFTKFVKQFSLYLTAMPSQLFTPHSQTGNSENPYLPVYFIIRSPAFISWLPALTDGASVKCKVRDFTVPLRNPCKCRLLLPCWYLSLHYLCLYKLSHSEWFNPGDPNNIKYSLQCHSFSHCHQISMLKSRPI